MQERFFGTHLRNGIVFSSSLVLVDSDRELSSLEKAERFEVLGVAAAIVFTGGSGKREMRK